MKTFIVGAGSDLGVHIDGAHLGPIQLMNDLKSFYKGESFSLIQNENIIKSRNLSDRRKNEYEIDKFNTELYKVILEKEIPEHQEGIQFILHVLTDEKYGCIKDFKEIDA